MNEINESYDTDSVREFTVSDADAGPYALAEGPDGALWFTLVHRGAVARRDPDDGRVTVHPVGDGPTVIAPGPDGALWFTEYRAHRIGRITPEGHYASFAPSPPRAGRSGSPRGRTAPCGSRSPRPTGSAASPWTARSPSIRRPAPSRPP